MDSAAAAAVCGLGAIRVLYAFAFALPHSRATTTAAATAARTKTRTGRRLCQQRQLQGVGIGNGSCGINLGPLLRSVPRGAIVLASHWCRADMRGSVKRVLCVCQLSMGISCFFVRILTW